MAVAEAFDGANRLVYLDSSVAASSWRPLDLFVEYLRFRRDEHAFRRYEPLMRMRGGEPKGGGKFAPRFLQLLTDKRGLTTKLVLPDIGPYRTFVDGEIATDNPDLDPEPFDVGDLTTSGIIVDYKPAEAEIISVVAGATGGFTDQDRVDLLLTRDLSRDAARFSAR